MLAIFRCLSCKYSFSADLAKQDAMGAPGRVFVSGEVMPLRLDAWSCNEKLTSHANLWL